MTAKKIARKELTILRKRHDYCDIWTCMNKLWLDENRWRFSSLLYRHLPPHTLATNVHIYSQTWRHYRPIIFKAAIDLSMANSKLCLQIKRMMNEKFNLSRCTWLESLVQPVLYFRVSHARGRPFWCIENGTIHFK